MIDIEKDYRIIGDFLETNATILEKKIKSKAPKFISELRHKRDLNKLIKILEKLKNSDYIMKMEQISELFNFIYNNYDEHCYKSIVAIKIVRNGITFSNIEGAVQVENYVAVIRFNTNDTMFDFIGTDTETNNRIDITLNRLYSDNPKYSKIISAINKELRSVMCDYILDIITRYKED